MNNDTKKLIGTIIGVACFAALIAGATFAWFSSAANVKNGVYNLSAKNFTVEYTKGNNINTGNIKYVSSASATPSNTTNIQLKVRQSGSVPGKITIKLHSSGTFASTGLVHYAVCNGTCSSFTDKKTISSAGELSLFEEALNTTTQTYNVYFWIEDVNLNDHIGKTYSGYIDATAVQTE